MFEVAGKSMDLSSLRSEREDRLSEIQSSSSSNFGRGNFIFGDLKLCDTHALVLQCMLTFSALVIYCFIRIVYRSK